MKTVVCDISVFGVPSVNILWPGVTVEASVVGEVKGVSEGRAVSENPELVVDSFVKAVVSWVSVN